MTYEQKMLNWRITYVENVKNVELRLAVETAKEADTEVKTLRERTEAAEKLNAATMKMHKAHVELSGIHRGNDKWGDREEAAREEYKKAHEEWLAAGGVE